ncbi:hypothetical protein ACLB2K_051362 [Fragaria x ananassa]
MWIFGWKGPSGFSARSTAEYVTQGIDGTGLTALVTGASSGLGLETTRVLALRGVHVIMAVRNADAGRDVKESILKEVPTAKIDVMELDLSSLASVRKFASDYKLSGHPLNILINNAGVMATPFMLSHDNIEMQFATNHLGHFLLTNLLLDTMKKTANESKKEGRIVIVSSEGHRFAYREGVRFDMINNESVYNSLYAYGQSKLANILHASELAKRLKGFGNTHFLLVLVSKRGASGFSGSSTAEEVTEGIDGTGLAAIVTGATSGIGLETLRVLALRGVHVVMSIRNMNSGKKVREAILREIPDAKIDAMELDLSSLASVRKFAADYNTKGLPLNILINNAGVITPYKLSEDNIELQFATNHLGLFLLTNLLLENMKRTSRENNREGRIVNVSSVAHKYSYHEGIRFDKINDESSYNKYFAYGQSKLANVLHANELARRLKEEGVEITANSLHPGLIHTNIVRFGDGILHYIAKLPGAFISLFIKSIQQGAATTCFVALHPQVNGVSGEYFVDCNVAEASSLAKDEDLATKLWDLSLSLTNLK